MQGFDHTDFEFGAKFGILIGFMIAIMIFGVALDLRWAQFRRLISNPKAPLIGLAAQLLVLPAFAYVIGLYMIDDPPAALGLILVSAVPAGAVSNYLTGLCKGEVATSVTMTALNTAFCLVTTPLIFGFWASLNPATATLLQTVRIEPGKLIAIFIVTLGLPVVGGMLLAAKRPDTARRIRPWVSRLSAVILLTVVSIGVSTNFRLLLAYAQEALLPAAIVCFGAHILGWTVGWLTRLSVGDRRAVTIEVGGQSVNIAIGLALAFFPTYLGVAVMAVVFGTVQFFLLPVFLGLWWRPSAKLPAVAPTVSPTT
jgi:bile acid:Na+ symporter, BASS family